MLDSELFEALDQIARQVRRAPGRPFGGIQLICVGDFYQLPPVGLGESVGRVEGLPGGRRGVSF